MIRQKGPRRFYQYANVDRARVQGAELGLSFEPNTHWRWNHDVTLLHTRDRSSGQPLPDRPRRTWNSQLRYTQGGWQAQLAMQWVGAQTTSGNLPLPGYRVFNALSLIHI